MLFEGFGIAILNFLGIPPGVAYRKAGSKQHQVKYSIKENDIINSIIEITVDDVCLGNSPLFLCTESKLSYHLSKKLELILGEFNSIVRWAAMDLLKYGVSVYSTSSSKENNLIILPLVGEYRFFLTSEKKIVILDSEDKVVKDALLFINYDKESLAEIEDKDLNSKFKFEITPSPIQLKNISKIARDLDLVEKSMVQYRRQVSKLVRLVAVDIGISQGDKQQDIIDSVSSAINANSSTLEDMDEFNDEIPVVPMRKGLGKPEIVDSMPNFDISDIKDLDHHMGKLYMALRFPKSYADFSTALDGTAVSTIRGDVRYSRLIDYARTKIVDTINNFLAQEEKLKSLLPIVSLTELPTPEDDDVIASIESYVEISNDIFENIIGGSATKEEATLKLDLLLTALGGVTSFKYLHKWTDLIKNYIELHFGSDEEEEVTAEYDGPDSGDNIEVDNTVEDIDFDNNDVDEFPEQTEE